MSSTQRRTRALTASLRALATAVALTTLMSSCGGDDSDADVAAPTATAEAGTPTASESTDAACQSVLDDAAAEAAALRASNLTALKVTRSADKLNTVVDQAAADCELAVMQNLEGAVNDLSDAGEAYLRCAVEACDTREVGTAIGGALRSIDRAVAAGP